MKNYNNFPLEILLNDTPVFINIISSFVPKLENFIKIKPI